MRTTKKPLDLIDSNKLVSAGRSIRSQNKYGGCNVGWPHNTNTLRRDQEQSTSLSPERRAGELVQVAPRIQCHCREGGARGCVGFIVVVAGATGAAASNVDDEEDSGFQDFRL